MQFSIFQESRRGARKLNQDRVACSYSREAILMLVADGMGGHLHGELAAQTAMRTIVASFRRAAQPVLADPGRFLRESLLEAHRAILELAETRRLSEAPRTTCVACVVQEGSASWAHAGDSRLYHVRDGTVLSHTRDHSLVQELIARGRMREEARAAHPDRNRIYSCLGSNQPPRIDLAERVALAAGDLILLCSDGLWGPLSGKAVGAAFLTQGVLDATPQLLDEAERRAGRSCDNLSVVALCWEDPAVSTRHMTLPGPSKPRSFVDVPPQAGAAQRETGAYLSDDEFERAIDHIQAELKRQTDDQT